MYLPESSAAALVTTLKVDPGTNSPSVARFSSGAGGEQEARMLLIAPKLLSTRFGSKVGREAATSTAPVRVSSATTEPHLPASCSIASTLCTGPQGQPEVVALDRRAADPVERGVEDGVEVRVGAGQIVVLRGLEPGAGAGLGRVADDVREQPVLRVTPEVERLARHASLAVGGQDRAVGGADQPALDRELRHPLDLVVLPVGEPGGRPGLPVGRCDDQRGHEAEADEREAGDLAVHARSALARLETSRRPASRTKFATTLEPP